MNEEWPESPFTVRPPFYLATVPMDCWKCRARFTVACLIAPNVEGVTGNVAMFSDVEILPSEIVVCIRQRVPTYQYLAKNETYGNVCPNCHQLTGDHYLISEPDGPFFPQDEEEAQRITLEEIPHEGSIEIEAAIGFGCGEMILANAIKRPARLIDEDLS